MKQLAKIFLVLAIIGGLAGCPMLCLHKTEIMTGIQAVITSAQAVENEAQAVVNDIKAKYPNLPIPAEIQVVLDKANKVIGQAQEIYNEAQIVAQIVCPVQGQLDTLNQELKDAQANLAATQNQYAMAKMKVIMKK